MHHPRPFHARYEWVLHSLENLRKEPDLRDIPVIILTGADLTPEQHQQLSDYGMHFLTKAYYVKMNSQYIRNRT